MLIGRLGDGIGLGYVICSRPRPRLSLPLTAAAPVLSTRTCGVYAEPKSGPGAGQTAFEEWEMQ